LTRIKSDGGQVAEIGVEWRAFAVGEPSELRSVGRSASRERLAQLDGLLRCDVRTACASR